MFLEEVRSKAVLKKASMHIMVMQSYDKGGSLDSYTYSERKSLLSRTLCWGDKMSTLFRIPAAKIRLLFKR